MRIFCLLGPPAVGKTPLANRLRGDLGIPAYSYRRWLDEVEAEGRSGDGGLTLGYEAGFLERVAGCGFEAAVLDGFPRTVGQAEMLLSLGAVVVPAWIGYSGGRRRRIATSLARQCLRSLAFLKAPDFRKHLAKARRAEDLDRAAFEHLRARLPWAMDYRDVDAVYDGIRAQVSMARAEDAVWVSSQSIFGQNPSHLR